MFSSTPKVYYRYRTQQYGVPNPSYYPSDHYYCPEADCTPEQELPSNSISFTYLITVNLFYFYTIFIYYQIIILYSLSVSLVNVFFFSFIIQIFCIFISIGLVVAAGCWISIGIFGIIFIGFLAYLIVIIYLPYIPKSPSTSNSSTLTTNQLYYHID